LQAQLRFAGKQANLYPSDSFHAMLVDSICETLSELAAKLFVEKDAAKVPEARKCVKFFFDT
jgi:hypothetical protein